jgi:hypothetical protein
MPNGLKGRQALRSTYLSYFSSRAIYSEEVEENMEDMEAAHSLILNLFLQESSKEHGLSEEYSASYDNDLAGAVSAYDLAFNKGISSFDALVRTLYRLFMWVDEYDLNEREKWHYVALIRAQLSWHELVFLLYNGMTEPGKKFVPLAERYALFDNLTPSDDFIVSYIIYASNKNAGVHALIPYTAASFNSEIARERHFKDAKLVPQPPLN